MRLQRLICLSGLLLATSIGCCHTQSVSSNACDPCGQGMSGGCGCGCSGGGGGGLKSWWQNKMARRHNYSWFNDSSCGGCSVCGGEDCGMSGGGTCGIPSTGAGPTCGCGQSHGYAPASISPDQTDPPAPIPNTGAPTPPRSNEPIPAPGSSPSTTFQQPTSGQIQHVSLEEFQRLPGVVISGSHQSSVPTMAQPNMVPPALSTVSVPPRPIDSVQQAQWVPAK